MSCLSQKLIKTWLLISTFMTTIIGLFNFALGFSLWGLELNRISEGPPVVHILLGIISLLSGSCGFHGVIKRNPIRLGLFNVCNILLFILFVPFGVLLVFFGRKIQEEMVCGKDVSAAECAYENRLYQRDRLEILQNYGIIVLAFAGWMLQNFLLTIFICSHRQKAEILLIAGESSPAKQEEKQLDLKQVQDKNSKYQLVNNTTEANDTKV